VDYGDKGAARLSVLPLNPNQVCQEDVQPEEFVIQDWSGYFYGVKDAYAFFSADDGSLGGGMAFMVLRLKDHKIVFTDEADFAGASGIQIHSVVAKADGLRIRYRRSYRADCSVVADGGKCLSDLNKKTGVAKDFAGKCLSSYRQADAVRAKKICKMDKPKDPNCYQKELKRARDEDDSTPSYIKYDVEAFIPSDSAAFDLEQDEATQQAQTASLLKKKTDVIVCTASL
jgi:hypothetical protein